GLREKRLGGAGIDVLEVEPPPANHPLLSGDIPNLIITPHIAWASHAARQRLLDELALNIQAFQRGVLRNQVA
ncbi:NAD(P)-dependent oxidoreductase, partial [Acidihalobacter prosperus]